MVHLRYQTTNFQGAIVASIRQEYDLVGVSTYYQTKADQYRNPHERYVICCLDALWEPSFESVLDFACGDGLITKHLLNREKNVKITGADKFMGNRYMQETKKQCLNVSFEDIASFKEELPTVDVVVISYALDLIQESYLQSFLYALSLKCKYLLVIRPNGHELSSPYWTLIKKCKYEKSRGTLYQLIS